MKQFGWFIGSVLALALSATAHADSIQNIVAFGDSLSDTGNLYAVTGLPPAPYYQGRFSNGPLWIEDLAATLGVPALTPSLFPGGNNYAWAGTESGTGLTSDGLPNLRTQVGQYLSGHTPGPGDLFSIWSGGNDFRDGQTNPFVPVQNILAAITDLAAAGGTHFLVADLPPLGEIPEALHNPLLSDADRHNIDLFTYFYNGILEQGAHDLAGALGVRIDFLDVGALFTQIQADKSAFGITNISDGALSDGVFSGNGFLFWDDHHPTAQVGELIAERALTAVTPVPASFWLMGLGGLGLLWRRRIG